MRSIESVRNKKIEEYVFISQVLFFLLTGILLVRVVTFSEELSLVLYLNVALLAVPLLGLFIIKGLERRWYVSRKEEYDSYLNGIYLVCTVFLLVHERESFFKLLLLMPVVANALYYGAKRGYVWAFFSTLGIIIIDIVQKAEHIDVDILVLSTIWLFAWLLGKMSETEMEVREELQRQASVDGLTGVFNHRSFHDFLEEYFLKAKIANSSLTLIMIDVDFFKYYNDAYGHQRGDVVLKELAGIIEEGVQDQGICARYGGDEFVILLPGSDSSVGFEVGERIRQRVESTPFEGDSILPKGHFSISVGIASFPDHADSKEKLLQKADEALYKAKHTNTNKVELYYSVFDEIEHFIQDKEKDLLNSMRTLLMVVNAKDKYTYGHSERVMHYAIQVGRKLAMWEWEIQNLMIGALLHDIGKIEIGREILNKPGKLTSEEWDAIRQHPVWGADIIRPMSSLSGAVDIVMYHHENYDGTGYPSGIKGDDIPLGARILRLADSFDAMTSVRPYKKVFTMSEAAADLIKNKGILYDPEVVDAFLEYILDTGIISEEVS